MRMIAHISDLHFGRVDEAVLDPLRKCLVRLAPHLIVISGDLTQRARSEQFEAAREYLDSLPQPQLVVPGNHDVPLYNVFKRFVNPLKNYRRYITPDLEPWFVDDEIAVAGVNTARSLTWKDGRINEQQIGALRRKFDELGDHVVKIVVTHHPFDLPEGNVSDQVVGRAAIAMQAFSECGADLLLSGHMHLSHAGNTARRHAIEGYAALTLHAGSTTSTRGRGESNSFNAIHVDGESVDVERYSWFPENNEFAVTSRSAFEHKGDVWAEKVTA
jgi:3',5'-cyclic AMP phosphodiesterase CpdA